MKHTTTVAAAAGIIIAVGILNSAGVATAPENPSRRMTPSVEDPYETMPIIDAYYEGEKMWFIHTDVSDEQMARRLTMMVGYHTIHSRRLGEILRDKAGKFYVFTNGVEQEGVEPWGGGPLGYQIDIFESVPGDEGYTPLRNPHLVTWTESATPRILKSVAELLEAEQSGELTIRPTDVIVNAPVVRWPTDYLGGRSRIDR